MNIFELNGKEFEKKVDEILNDLDSKKLYEELISCGLEINDAPEYSVNSSYIVEECNYSIEFIKIGFWDKLLGKKEEISNDLMEAA